MKRRRRRWWPPDPNCMDNVPDTIVHLSLQNLRCSLVHLRCGDSLITFGKNLSLFVEGVASLRLLVIDESSGIPPLHCHWFDHSNRNQPPGQPPILPSVRGAEPLTIGLFCVITI